MMSHNTKLARNFTFGEVIKSQTARRRGINNSPSSMWQVINLTRICALVQRARDELGPLMINSGFRGEELNNAIGGAENSQHVLGCALDIEGTDVSNVELADWFAANCKGDFDQLILEFFDPDLGDPNDGWVHISVPDVTVHAPRGEKLIIADGDNGVRTIAVESYESFAEIIKSI